MYLILEVSELADAVGTPMALCSNLCLKYWRYVLVCVEFRGIFTSAREKYALVNVAL